MSRMLPPHCTNRSPASTRIRLAWVVCAATATALIGFSRPAVAVDGCLVLLCFAAPSWRAIPQCVPPIRQVFTDLAKGRPFPSCAMAGGGNNAANAWADPPSYCPVQYTQVIELENGRAYRCDYNAAVSMTLDGRLWARTWWSFAGDTVTEFTPAAKAMLGSWDPRFDDDYAAWLALQPPPPPPCAENC